MTPRERKWTRIGGDNITKWTTPGQTIEGEFMGFKSGRFGQLGMVRTADGAVVTFPIHAALEKLNNVKVGASVMLQYLGLDTTKSGREFKNFDIFVGNADDYQDSDKHDTGVVPF